MYIFLLAYFTAITGRSHLLTQRNPTQLLTSPMLISTGCTKQTKVQAFLYIFILINRINLLSVINSKVDFRFFYCAFVIEWNDKCLLFYQLTQHLFYYSRVENFIGYNILFTFINLKYYQILYIIL